MTVADEAGHALPSAATTDAPTDPAIVAFWELSVDFPLIETAFRDGDPGGVVSFTVRLGPDRSAEVDVDAFEELADDEGVYSGKVRDRPDSQAVFSYVGLAYAGTVILSAEQRAFYITATEDGQMRITELDLAKAPGCGEPLLAQAPTPPVDDQ